MTGRTTRRKFPSKTSSTDSKRFFYRSLFSFSCTYSTYLKLDRALFLPRPILLGAESWKPPPRPVTPPPPSNEPWEEPAPEPTLAGENDGTWLRSPAFINKRLDIQLLGIAAYSTRTARGSGKWLRLEGKTAVLVVQQPVIDDSKLQVYQVGSPTGNPEKVPAPCIKPRRTLADGQTIGTSTQRVVIVGPGVNAPLPENIGRYAETRPDLTIVPGMYGSANIVWVRVEGGDVYLYHTSSLCLALNVAILSASTSNFV